MLNFWETLTFRSNQQLFSWLTAWLVGWLVSWRAKKDLLWSGSFPNKLQDPEPGTQSRGRMWVVGTLPLEPSSRTPRAHTHRKPAGMESRARTWAYTLLCTRWTPQALPSPLHQLSIWRCQLLMFRLVWQVLYAACWSISQLLVNINNHSSFQVTSLYHFSLQNEVCPETLILNMCTWKAVFDLDQRNWVTKTHDKISYVLDKHKLFGVFSSYFRAAVSDVGCTDFTK